MASVNDLVGNYRLVAKLACGSFGCVYRSEHHILKNRVVAIKLMHNAHLNSQKEQDLFLDEARLLEMLTHPHILPIIDVGVHEGFPYLVTEYAPNGSLLDRLKRQQGKPLPLEEATTILTQIGQGLQHAHEQGVVHRDLKPENILFRANGEALLADFGIAKMLATAGIRQGTIIGTPPYMAPEQFKGTASKEGDQYALGCIAYELFTGQKPFSADDMVAMMFKHLMENPPAPRALNPQLPADIEWAILKAMAKERTERYADVAAFLAALRVPPKTKEQWLNEGDAHYDAKRYRKALAAYERAVLLDPNDAIAYSGKGWALWRLHRNEEALAAYERAILLDLTYANAYEGRGNALFSRKHYEEALAAFDRAILLDPTYASAYNGKGNTLFSRKHYEEALAAFDRAILLDPTDALPYEGRGNALFSRKHYEEALAAYDRAILLDPNDASAYEGRGNALFSRKHYEEALAAYDRAILLDPNDANAYNNKGIVLESLRRKKEAQQAYEKARQLGYSG